MSVNRVTLIGRLGVDPESRSFPNGGSVCNLRIATEESWRDKNTGEKQSRVEWHRVTLQNKLGEIAQQYLKKGSQIYIEGSIRTRKWQNQQGEDQYTTEIIGRNMTMLDSKSGGDNSQQKPANHESGSNDEPDYYNDSIPF